MESVFQIALSKEMRIYLISCFLLISISISAQDTISVRDFGLLPNSRENTAPYVIKSIEACRNKQEPVLFFPKGRYDFWPSDCEMDIFIPWFSTLKEPDAPVGIFIDSLDNLLIDGDSSLFVFHGNMMCIGVKNSRNTTIKNITIDWDRPFISQATVGSFTEEYMDIKIDRLEYPYMIEDHTLFFTGEGWRDKAVHHCLFDKEKKEIVYLTRDNPLGDIKDWFEAGGVTDVLIRRNVFDDCVSSAEPGAWKWGEAVICITPSHIPDNEKTEPYHRNIRIENNLFRFYDYPLLHARSVRGLFFINNKMECTKTYPQHGRKVNFYLDGCRETEISGNIFDEPFPGRNIELHHMLLSDLKTGNDQNLKILNLK